MISPTVAGADYFRFNLGQRGEIAVIRYQIIDPTDAVDFDSADVLNSAVEEALPTRAPVAQRDGRPRMIGGK